MPVHLIHFIGIFLIDIKISFQIIQDLGIVNSQLKKMDPTQKEQINKKARILFKKFKYSLKNFTFII